MEENGTAEKYAINIACEAVPVDENTIAVFSPKGRFTMKGTGMSTAVRDVMFPCMAYQERHLSTIAKLKPDPKGGVVNYHVNASYPLQ